MNLRPPRLLLRALGAGLAAALAAAALPAPAQPSDPAPDGQRLHAIVNIDLAPSQAEAGAALLRDYLARARSTPEIAAIVLLQQSAASNHFILDESFTDPAAYRRFVEQPEVIAFRNKLAPYLGSPWDERLGVEVAPAKL